MLIGVSAAGRYGAGVGYPKGIHFKGGVVFHNEFIVLMSMHVV